MGFTVIKNDLFYETQNKLNIRFQETWCKELLELIKTGVDSVGGYLAKNVYPNLPTHGAKELKKVGLDLLVRSLKTFRDEPRTFFKSFKAFGRRNGADIPVPTRLEFLDGTVFTLPAEPGGGSDYYNVVLPSHRIGTIPFDRIIIE